MFQHTLQAQNLPLPHDDDEVMHVAQGEVEPGTQHLFLYR